MTFVLNLLIAGATGIVVALISRAVIPALRSLPAWLVLLLGAAAAGSGTVAIWLTGATAEQPLRNLMMQVLFAGAGVTAMAATARRRPAPGSNADRRP